MKSASKSTNRPHVCTTHKPFASNFYTLTIYTPYSLHFKPLHFTLFTFYIPYILHPLHFIHLTFYTLYILHPSHSIPLPITFYTHSFDSALLCLNRNNSFKTLFQISYTHYLKMNRNWSLPTNPMAHPHTERVSMSTWNLHSWQICWH